MRSPQIEYFDAQIVHRISYYDKCNLQLLRDVLLMTKFLLVSFRQYLTFHECGHANSNKEQTKIKNKTIESLN